MEEECKIKPSLCKTEIFVIAAKTFLKNKFNSLRKDERASKNN